MSINLANNNEQKLVIIDASNIIFRAYYSQPELKTKNGQIVGAVYGFISILLKIIGDFSPSHIVLACDSGKINFRHKLYEAYKANRKALPEDLISQFPLIKEAIKSLMIASIEQEGFEADDLIATINKRITGIKKIIISSDKDLFSLMGDETSIYDPLKSQYIDRSKILEKFQVEPSQIREVLSLIGDSSDNVPGVPKIGIKTAAILINQFGSVNNLFTKLHEVKSASQRKNLEDSKEMAFLSWQLIGLEDNVPVNFLLNDFIFKIPDTQKIFSFLDSLNFKSLYKRVENIFNISFNDEKIFTAKKENNSSHVQLVNFIEQIEEIKNKSIEEGYIGIIAIDINEIDNSKNQIKNNILFFALKNIVYIVKSDIFSSNKDFLTKFYKIYQSILVDKSIKKITYNIKKIYKIYEYYQNLVKADHQLLVINAIEDTQLMEYLISSDEMNFYQELEKKISNHDLIEIASQISSLKENYFTLLQNLKNIKALNLYEEMDKPLSAILHKMELTGIKINPDILKDLSNNLDVEIRSLEEKIYIEAGQEFNIASPKQVGEILFEKMSLPNKKISKKSGIYSTNAEILKELSENNYKIADLLLKWREFSKLKNTYIDVLPKKIQDSSNRLHTCFLQTSTNTARLSSKDPNLQNIPVKTKEGEKIRRAFIAEEGYFLVSADYSQIELRILAELANVSALKEAFRNKEDIHAKVACSAFNIRKEDLTEEYRRKAKAINFGIIYGISSFGLAKQLNITSQSAHKYIEDYFREYPEIIEYMNKTEEFAKANGYVCNLFGRRCYIENINSSNHHLRNMAKRAAINAPIQSTSADIIKFSMIELDKIFTEKNFRTKILLQIHDELLFEVPKQEIDEITKLIKKIMENSIAYNMVKSVDVKIGKNWQEMEKI